MDKNKQARDYFDKWQKEIFVAMKIIADSQDVTSLTLQNEMISKKDTWQITTTIKKLVTPNK